MLLVWHNWQRNLSRSSLWSRWNQLKSYTLQRKRFFVCVKQCQQVYYTYTPSFRKDRSRVDWLFVLKTKPRGRVEVVQDENEDTSVLDEVFQASELVEPYGVTPSINFEENSNFRVFDDSLLMLTQRSWMLFWAIVD
jgi:hypothetical protein